MEPNASGPPDTKDNQIETCISEKNPLIKLNAPDLCCGLAGLVDPKNLAFEGHSIAFLGDTNLFRNFQNTKPIRFVWHRDPRLSPANSLLKA